MTSSKLGKYLSGLGLLGLVIFLCVIPFYSTDYIVSVLLDILTWIGLTESWIILSGFTGYISLGHSAFFGIGAYVMAISWLKLPYPLIVLISATSSMALAFAIGFPVLRVRGPYFVILTLGLSEFAKYIFINYEVNVKGTVGRILLGVPNIRTLYFSLLIIAIVTILCAYLIKRSRFGYGLFSIREDEDAAESLGIDTSIYKWLAFGISAFFPGAIGATMALRRTYIDAVFRLRPHRLFSDYCDGFLWGNGKAPRARSGRLHPDTHFGILMGQISALLPYHFRSHPGFYCEVYALRNLRDLRTLGESWKGCQICKKEMRWPFWNVKK